MKKKEKKETQVTAPSRVPGGWSEKDDVFLWHVQVQFYDHISVWPLPSRCVLKCWLEAKVGHIVVRVGVAVLVRFASCVRERPGANTVSAEGNPRRRSGICNVCKRPVRLDHSCKISEVHAFEVNTGPIRRRLPLIHYAALWMPSEEGGGRAGRMA